MTQTRSLRRTWWTACSPYSEECPGPFVDLSARVGETLEVDSDPARRAYALTSHPSVHREGILRALQGGPRTFAELAAEVIRVPFRDAQETGFEFALWAMCEAGALKFSPEAPVKFAAWFSVCDPDFETAYDRALAARFD